MVVGNGQLAKAFKSYELHNTCIFASGVSNSTCTDFYEFERERKLLIKYLEEAKDKKFVYFSSCALSADDYPKNEYYRHKENMENIIKEYSDQYYIFRVPQLFGSFMSHKTLINFIYNSVLNGNEFEVYDEAYRYVIEIGDVRTIVESVVNCLPATLTLDIGNPYRYSVLEIVEFFEGLLGKKANYKIINRSDAYELSFDSMILALKCCNVELEFSQEYIFKKVVNALTHRSL